MSSGLEGPSDDNLYLLIAVSDTGCGLNDEEKQRLFLKFSQASPRTHVQVINNASFLCCAARLTSGDSME